MNLEYCVQVKVGGHWQVVTEHGKPMVFGEPGAAVDLCNTLNDQCGKWKHRVAMRSVSDWCEMARSEK